MIALSQIVEHKIVAILRGMPPAEIINIAYALYNGGIRVLEITLNSEDALASIEELKYTFNNKMVIGAGTVITVNDADNAIAAGATFLISPSLDIEVIKAAKKANVASIPGAFTPTEIVTAYNNGADIIKVFPCLSADYIKNILAPLNFVKLMPTGGIDASNIKQYAKAGAVAFGIGGALVTKATIDEVYLENITAKAKALVTALNF